MQKILIIEDSPDLRDLILRTLAQGKFYAQAAEDGFVGIELARKFQPDLIICDLRMPGMDGYEVLQHLRQDQTQANVPFIFLSGMADQTNIRKGMDLGADDFLSKPFTVPELLTAVRTRLEKQQAIKKQSEKKLRDLQGSITLALPHELRTPLNGILGLAGYLMEDYEVISRKMIFDNCKLIYESAQRIHHLIENFLIYSQLEILASAPQDRESIRQAPPLDLNHQIQRVAGDVAGRYERTLDLAVKKLPGVELLMEEDHFNKIVEELTDNAFKFSKSDTPVCWELAFDNDHLVLTLSDHGRGIPSDQIHDMDGVLQFDRRVYEQQGMGLGLAISRRLAALYGGSLTVDSEVGAWTTLRIVFPEGAFRIKG